MKVCSSPRMRPVSATERRDGMRDAYASIGRPRTSAVVTLNIPPGPVSRARTSALVGMRRTYPSSQPGHLLSWICKIRDVRMSDGVEWALHCCTLLATLPEGQALPTARLAEFHEVP